LGIVDAEAKAELSQGQEQDMRQIVPGVYLIEGLRGNSANVYLLASGEELTLVDSGLPGAADQIAAQLQEKGYSLSHLQTIVLTHSHGDHTGGAAELARRSGAQIMAHQDEVPYIEQTEPLPFGSLPKRLSNWLGDRVLFRRAPCKVDRALQDGDVIEVLSGLQVIHTPGHTPGSIALYQPERRILFCGDAFFNKNPLTGKKGLQLSHSLFTLDIAQMRESARKLAALPVEVLCFGHGEPILEGAGDQLRVLLEEKLD
jgi:glyoxylase-like metal-dependent hydrolase (beta-lactamase superfamily II)